jgi:hypothetical protein
MVTKRLPIQRQRRAPEFTPETIEAFTHLRHVFENGDCTCPPIDRETLLKEGRPPNFPWCAACQAYHKAEGEVVGLLKLKPWQLLENPYFANPYPPGTPAWKGIENHKKLKTDIHGGFALWRRLEAACGLEPLEFDDDDDARP